MGSSIVPAIYDPRLADRTLEIGVEEARAMATQLAREEGLLVGLSAAAAVAACAGIAREEAAAGRGAVLVTVLPDAADSSLSKRLWKET
jgi:cysteine synthase B